MFAHVCMVWIKYAEKQQLCLWLCVRDPGAMVIHFLKSLSTRPSPSRNKNDYKQLKQALRASRWPRIKSPIHGSMILHQRSIKYQRKRSSSINIVRGRRLWMSVMWCSDAKFWRKLVIRPSSANQTERNQHLVAIVVVVWCMLITSNKSQHAQKTCECQRFLKICTLVGVSKKI